MGELLYKGSSLNTTPQDVIGREEFTNALQGKSDVGHTHTKSNITDFAHNHNDTYYTKKQTDDNFVTSWAYTTGFEPVTALTQQTTRQSVLTSGVSGSAAISATPFSDSRIKKNIEPSDINALDIINTLKPKSYDFVDEKYGSHSDLGFIAQELEKVISDSIIKVPDEEYGELCSVAYDRVVPYLIKAIQELNEKVETLSNKKGD